MSDSREAYPIQWNAPAAGGAAPSWNGPSPDTELPAQVDGARDQAVAADRGYPEAPQHASEPVGWAGAASTGETAQDISSSHPQDAGYGWSNDGGSSHFEAPDRDDHAPRRAAVETPERDNSDARVDALQATANVSDAPVTSEPASYAAAPQQGTTGSAAHEPWGGTAEATPPQVVGQNDDLPEDSLTIGRSRVNSIVLDDMLVSRRHVIITADDEGLLLRDLGSRNGTFVNGRRVEQTHLHEGDRIGIGASTFEVRDGWLVSV